MNDEAAGTVGVSFGAAGSAEGAEEEKDVDRVVDAPNPEKPENLPVAVGYVQG